MDITSPESVFSLPLRPSRLPNRPRYRACTCRCGHHFHPYKPGRSIACPRCQCKSWDRPRVWQQLDLDGTDRAPIGRFPRLRAEDCIVCRLFPELAEAEYGLDEAASAAAVAAAEDAESTLASARATPARANLSRLLRHLPIQRIAVAAGLDRAKVRYTLWRAPYMRVSAEAVWRIALAVGVDMRDLWEAIRAVREAAAADAASSGRPTPTMRRRLLPGGGGI